MSDSAPMMTLDDDEGNLPLTVSNTLFSSSLKVAKQSRELNQKKPKRRAYFASCAVIAFQLKEQYDPICIAQHHRVSRETSTHPASRQDSLTHIKEKHCPYTGFIKCDGRASTNNIQPLCPLYLELRQPPHQSGNAIHLLSMPSSASKASSSKGSVSSKGSATDNVGKDDFPSASFSSTSTGVQLRKKWNPFQVFLKRNRKKKFTYPQRAPPEESTHSPQQQAHGCQSDSTDDSMFLEIMQGMYDASDSNADATTKRFFTEKSVYEFVWSYHGAFAEALEAPDNHAAWQAFWFKYHTPDFLFIRPSGNPLNLEAFMKQMSKGEVSNYEEDVIMVDSIKILGDQTSAVIVYRSETRFTFQGNNVEDTRTNTIVLVWHDGTPKITSVQRSMGKDINATS